MSNKYDVIVVGGGFAGAHAAYPLVQAGLSVAMLDGGTMRPPNDVPDLDFEKIRRDYRNQWSLFLGEDLSGIMPPDIKYGHGGSMTSGAKSYVSAKTEDLLPIRGDAVVLQSLAKGGLGEVWGAACDFFDKEELSAIGIYEDLHDYYQGIVDRIGVSGINEGFILQPPAVPDDNTRLILKQNVAKKKLLDCLGLTVIQPPLALLTENMGDRSATRYHDMDYWHDPCRSVYRPRYTIEELEQFDNFTYIPDVLIKTVTDTGESVSVLGIGISDNLKKEFISSRVILAAGAPNTVRILLRSLGLYGIKVPFLMKPHVLIPCLQVGMLGKFVDPKKHSLCQLMVLDNEKKSGTTDCLAQLYSYKSLLFFKLTEYISFSKPESLKLASLIASSCMIADLRFGSADNTQSYMSLEKKSDGDYLEIYPYQYNKDYEIKQNNKIKKFKKAFRALGLWPLKVIKPKYETASHYGGGIVSIGSHESPLSADSFGKMNHSERIYIADTSTWRKLPTGPPTLTVMANANRIGNNVLKSLKFYDNKE